MKKSILFLLLFCLTGISAKAQCFEKNDKIIDAGIKISIYNIEAPDNENDDEDDGKAASYTIPIGFEYAVSNRIGVGLEIGICKYFTEEDSVTRAIAEASSFDVMLIANYHWVKKGKIDLYSGLGLGFSSFQYESHDFENSRYKGTGGYARISLINARFYVSNAVALGARFGLPFMDFSSGRIKDDLGTDAEYALKFSGWDLGASLSVRF